MNSSALKFFKNDQNFKGLIILDKSFKDFEDLKKKADSLPRAWYELSHLTIKDRIEFSRDFVLKVLPYIPHVYSFIFDFFSYLEDISIILTKKMKMILIFLSLCICLKIVMFFIGDFLQLLSLQLTMSTTNLKIYFQLII